MDPPPAVVAPTILHQPTSLHVSQPYIIPQPNSNHHIIYQQSLQRIEAVVKSNPNIRQFSWRWFNNLTSSEINKLIQLLPSQLVKLSFSGAFTMTCQELSSLVNKFVGLQYLNLNCRSENAPENLGWDLDYQINISNCMKNFRQSQKWCYLISQDLKTLCKQILPRLSSQMVSLGLRNIALGKNPSSLKTILQCCPNLRHLDLGSTQITDESFRQISKPTIQNFSSQIVNLKLDCNRVSNIAMDIIFPELANPPKSAEHKQKCYSNLRVLDISRTNVANPVAYISKMLPMLTYLGLGSLQITENQVAELRATQTESKIEQILIEYATLTPISISSLLKITPHLHSLSLSYIDTPPQYTGSEKQAQLGLTLSNKMKRINMNYNSYLVQGSLQGILKNAQSLDILKISGTKVNERDLMSVLKCCKSLKWIQISFLTHLEELISTHVINEVEEAQNHKKMTKLQLFNCIVDTLEQLQYIEAYEFLTEADIIQFKKRQNKANLVLVLDSNGPFSLKNP